MLINEREKGYIELYVCRLNDRDHPQWVARRYANYGDRSFAPVGRHCRARLRCATRHASANLTPYNKVPTFYSYGY